MEGVAGLQKIRTDLADQKVRLEDAIINVDTAIATLNGAGDISGAIKSANTITKPRGRKPKAVKLRAEKKESKDDSPRGKGHRNWTEDQRKAQGERMKKTWAKRRKERKAAEKAAKAESATAEQAA